MVEWWGSESITQTGVLVNTSIWRLSIRAYASQLNSGEYKLAMETSCNNISVSTDRLVRQKEESNSSDPTHRAQGKIKGVVFLISCGFYHACKMIRMRDSRKCPFHTSIYCSTLST
jgi:hypothetical protein